MQVKREKIKSNKKTIFEKNWKIAYSENPVLRKFDKKTSRVTPFESEISTRFFANLQWGNVEKRVFLGICSFPVYF